MVMLAGERAAEARMEMLVCWLESNPGSGKQVKDLFRELDADGSGDVDRGEFLAGIRSLKGFPKLSVGEIVGLMEDLDLNGDGSLTLEEFTQAIEDYLVDHPRPVKVTPKPRISREKSRTNVSPSVQRVPKPQATQRTGLAMDVSRSSPTSSVDDGSRPSLTKEEQAKELRRKEAEAKAKADERLKQIKRERRLPPPKKTKQKPSYSTDTIASSVTSTAATSAAKPTNKRHTRRPSHGERFGRPGLDTPTVKNALVARPPPTASSRQDDADSVAGFLSGLYSMSVEKHAATLPSITASDDASVKVKSIPISLTKGEQAAVLKQKEDVARVKANRTLAQIRFDREIRKMNLDAQAVSSYTTTLYTRFAG